MAIDIDHWCRHHLGAGVSEILFSAGHLSLVRAVRLPDGRTAVVKARADSPRLAACVKVQQMLWQAGFPAPQPLAGPITIDELAVTAEV